MKPQEFPLHISIMISSVCLGVLWLKKKAVDPPHFEQKEPHWASIEHCSPPPYEKNQPKL